MINDMAQEPIKTQAKAAAPAAPAEPAEDAVEKFLSEQKTLEAHRHDLIKELLRQKEAAMKEFDDKLEKLGYDGDRTSKGRPDGQKDKTQQARSMPGMPRAGPGAANHDLSGAPGG